MWSTLKWSANCTIPDRNLLLETIEPTSRKIECEFKSHERLERKLDLALNSYCHIYRIGRGLVAQEIHARTAAGHKAQVESGEGLAESQVGMLAKKGTDKDSEALLWLALMATLNIVEEDVPTAGAILDGFLHHAITVAINGPALSEGLRSPTARN